MVLKKSTIFLIIVPVVLVVVVVVVIVIVKGGRRRGGRGRRRLLLLGLLRRKLHVQWGVFVVFVAYHEFRRPPPLFVAFSGNLFLVVGKLDLGRNGRRRRLILFFRCRHRCVCWRFLFEDDAPNVVLYDHYHDRSSSSSDTGRNTTVPVPFFLLFCAFSLETPLLPFRGCCRLRFFCLFVFFVVFVSVPGVKQIGFFDFLLVRKKKEKKKKYIYIYYFTQRWGIRVRERQRVCVRVRWLDKFGRSRVCFARFLFCFCFDFLFRRLLTIVYGFR